MKCGSLINIQVDHIKPKSIHYKLLFNIKNLQVLCKDCNHNKSYIDETDYRTEKHKEDLTRACKLFTEYKEFSANTEEYCPRKHVKSRAMINKRRIAQGRKVGKRKGRTHLNFNSRAICNNYSKKLTSEENKVNCKTCKAKIRKRDRKNKPKIKLRKAKDLT